MHSSTFIPPDKTPILLIEGDEEIMKAIGSTLAQHSLRVIKAGSGEKGLDLVAAHDFALVLIDLKLPGIDGLETDRRVRASPGKESTPILFISLLDPANTHLAAGYSLGLVDFVFYPVAADILRSKVEVFADLHRKNLQARKQTQESEERFRLMIENTSDHAIFMLDREGRMASWNPGAERLLGYSEEEIIGKHSSVLFTPEDVASGSAGAELRKAEEDGRAVDERWHMRKDGSRFWASGILSAMRDDRGELMGFVKIMRDFTEREQARAALKESEERYRMLVDNVHDYAIYMLDPAGIVSSWNKGAERITGYRHEEIVGRHFSVFYPQGALAEGKPLAEMRTALEKGRNEDISSRVRKDGSIFWGDEIITAIRDESGSHKGFTKIMRDISSQKQAEEARQEHLRYLEGMSSLSEILEQNLEMEQVLKLAMEKLLDIFQCERTHLICPVELPGRVYRILFQAEKPGIPRLPDGEEIPVDEFIAAQTARLLSSPDPVLVDADNPLDGWKAYRDRYSVNSLMAAVLKVKYEKPWALCLEQIKDDPRPWSENDRQLFKDVARRLTDVLDNLLLHRNLQASEERLEIILQNIGDAILVFDPSGGLVYLNQAATRLFELPAPEQVLESTGKSLREELSNKIEIIDEKGRSWNLGEVLGQTARRGMEGPPLQFRIRTKPHGIERLVAIRSKRILDEQGRAQMAISILQDQTELRKTEELYRQSQKMEAIGRLAGGVAHDFNNLLTAINGYAELLLAVTDKHDSKRAHIDEIRKAGERAASLTNQLLVYSRKQIVAPRTVDLNAIVSQMEKMLRRLIGEDIELSTYLHPSPGLIKADPGQIEQVLLNLAVNSRDAMPHGGKLSIRTEKVDVGPVFAEGGESFPPGSYVRLTVSDTGVGMEEEVKSHLFEPFFSTKKTGTGLGLSTVYGIVRQSGGYVTVESDPGRGASFQVFFPSLGAREKAGGFAAEKSEDARLRGSETILVAEDDESVRKLVTATLASFGYRVIAASNGAEALELVKGKEGEIDLLLTDVVMARMDGRELKDRLRQIVPQVRTLFMSGYTDDAVVRHGVQGESEPFIQKPFTPMALADKVRIVLDAAVPA
jgi:two-component system cell cycle sensor histidine kinase/response regulator CckA